MVGLVLAALTGKASAMFGANRAARPPVPAHQPV
jgi:hypothetical protein